jgi:hypothetical protein
VIPLAKVSGGSWVTVWSTRVYKDGKNHYFTHSSISSETYRYLVRPHDVWVSAIITTDRDAAMDFGYLGNYMASEVKTVD